MYFVIGLPRTQINHDIIWVIVYRLTKSTYFLVIRSTFSLERLVILYINEIVLHGVLVSIVLDRDPQFTSCFLPKLHKALVTSIHNTTLHFSTAFHPQTNG